MLALSGNDILQQEAFPGLHGAVKLNECHGRDDFVGTIAVIHESR